MNEIKLITSDEFAEALVIFAEIAKHQFAASAADENYVPKITSVIQGQPLTTYDQMGISLLSRYINAYDLAMAYVEKYGFDTEIMDRVFKNNTVWPKDIQE